MLPAIKHRLKNEHVQKQSFVRPRGRISFNLGSWVQVVRTQKDPKEMVLELESPVDKKIFTC